MSGTSPPSISKGTAANYSFINETLRLDKMTSESGETEGRLLTDREIVAWLTEKYDQEEVLKIFNIYKGVEPKPIIWDDKARPIIPEDWSFVPFQNQPLQTLTPKKKKFYLVGYRFFERSVRRNPDPLESGQDELSRLERKAALDAPHPQTDEESTPFQGEVLQNTEKEVVVWPVKQEITKGQFCDQPWVEEHKKRYKQDKDGDLFIYRPSNPSQGKRLPNGYFIHLMACQKPDLERPSVEIKNPPTRIKRFFQYLIKLIQYLFHKCIVFPKKIARKMLNYKAQLPERSVSEDRKMRSLQKDGELLIYRPGKGGYSVHLLNPATSKRVTFTRQSDVEQEGFLAI